jgi:hypothetical protein
MALHKFIIENKTANIDPEGSVTYTRFNISKTLKRGDRFIYAPSRGSYYSGIFLGTSASGSPVCLTAYTFYEGTYNPVSISRIDTNHLMPMDWPNEYGTTKLFEAFKQYEEEVSNL